MITVNEKESSFIRCSKTRERKYWVHLINRRRDDLGLYATCSGIAVENFDIIFGLMEPHSRRQDTTASRHLDAACH